MANTNWQKRTDEIVANFTKDLLGLAREGGIDFDTAGVLESRSAEVNRVMEINNDVVKALLAKE